MNHVKKVPNDCMEASSPIPEAVPVQPVENFHVQVLVCSRKDDESNKTEYEITLVLDGKAFYAMPYRRFSELRKVFKQFLMDSSGIHFPSRGLFFTSVDVNEREASLIKYFTALLNPRRIRKYDFAGHRDFRNAMGVQEGSEAERVLLEVSQRRKDIVAQMDQAAAQEKALIEKQHYDDFTFSQHFNSVARMSVPPGQLSTLTYDHPLEFQMTEKCFSLLNDETISGPGGYEWMKTRRMNLGFFGDTEFSIVTLTGETLMIMKRSPGLFEYHYDLFRVDSANQPIPMCRVVYDKVQFSFAREFRIQLHAAARTHPYS